jgi:hypothetical protein
MIGAVTVGVVATVSVGVDDGGAVGLPLASALSVIGQCLGYVGHCVGTMNVGSHALFLYDAA